jgi:hypothetical protein
MHAPVLAALGLDRGQSGMTTQTIRPLLLSHISLAHMGPNACTHTCDRGVECERAERVERGEMRSNFCPACMWFRR